MWPPTFQEQSGAEGDEGGGGGGAGMEEGEERKNTFLLLSRVS